MNESEIRERFARLREVERGQVTDFAQTWSYARSRPNARSPLRDSGESSRLRVRPLAIVAAAAVVIVAVWLANVPSFAHRRADPEIATWRAPSDVLLEIPGGEVLSDMPALSESLLDKMLAFPSKRGT